MKRGKRQNQVSMTSPKPLDPVMPKTSNLAFPVTWTNEFPNPAPFLFSLSSSQLLLWLQLQALEVIFNFTEKKKKH